MSSRTLINGTSYKIIGGTTLVGGAVYRVLKGRTLVNGTGYNISLNQIQASGTTYTSTSAQSQTVSLTYGSPAAYRLLVSAIRTGNTDSDRTGISIYIPITSSDNGKTLSFDVSPAQGTMYPRDYFYSDFLVDYAGSRTHYAKGSTGVSKVITYNSAYNYAHLFINCGADGYHYYDFYISNLKLGDRLIMIN